MSDESGLSKIIDAIGRLKLSEKATAMLTALAILKSKSGGIRWFRWALATTVGLGTCYWNRLIG
ncbi:hypothetical protein [Bradyrhizobium sp. USDA 4473]